jgi:hypothetical protein
MEGEAVDAEKRLMTASPYPREFDVTSTEGRPPGTAPDARPVSLTDIDRALQETAAVLRQNAAGQIRTWRSDLTAALESLTYAGYVLATDVAILRNSIAEATADSQALVDNLPTLLAESPGPEDWKMPPDLPRDPAAPGGPLGMSGALVSAHDEMARTDFGSPADVARALRELEEQLESVAERRDAVEHRLREVRAAIVQQYKDGTLTPDEWLT